MSDKEYKEITIRVELYEDIEMSDFQQLLLEEGIENVDCSFEIIEN